MEKLPTCFERCNYQKGDYFIARVTQVFDISKFWMVTKPKELELYQKYLVNTYNIHKDDYKLPKEEIALGLYCVVFEDNSFYRGKIIGFPVVRGLNNIQIFFIDYGMMSLVDPDSLYKLDETCSDVPEFAVRASLYGICPKSAPIWTSDDVEEFQNLHEFEELCGLVINVDTMDQRLDVYLRKQNHDAPLIHEVLITKKCAQFFHLNLDFTKMISKNHGFSTIYEPTSKYPYLYPSHKDLESGLLPFKLQFYEAQLKKGPLKLPLTRYWRKKSNPE